ncbi:MAG TPA: hypothetical protein VFI22_17150 [Thermomicrobiales bacterium]|nr:hypothetical protein [Thermomicrobiales bacterium]
MDDGAFDSLARVLGGRAGSRRAATGGLVGLALATALSPPAADARRRKKKKKCKTCHIRKHGKCRKARDDSACNGDGRCLNGVCNAKPDCVPAGVNCSVAGSCCSESCVILKGPPGKCGSGNAGKPCLTDVDCTSQNCVGFVCQ